ncbi:MAG: hypothetical protein J6N77_06100 [Lachnospiraceae bacterium]|nr:hypothetical protein [Lachnospiraceae bacterium]
MKDKIWAVVRTALLAVILLLAFAKVQQIVSSPSDPRNYQLIRGFYAEPENSLDVVMIGGSNAYAFYQAPVMWAAEGIRSASYSCNGNRMSAAKYFMEEARKKQKDALFVVVMNEYLMDLKENKIHFHTDYMPFSMNKVHLIEDLCGRAGYTWKEKLEYYFPIIRYHSRWKELTKADFHYQLDGLKGASYYDKFLDTAKDMSGRLPQTDDVGEIPAETQECLNDLMDYCEQNQLKVLFVHSAQIIPEEELAVYNAIDGMLESRGFDTLNLCNYTEEIGYDLAADYYNPLHNNVHGSLKASRFLANYLAENYGLGRDPAEEKDPSWAAAWEKYQKEIAEAVTEDEIKAVTGQ